MRHIDKMKEFINKSSKGIDLYEKMKKLKSIKI